MFFAVRTSGVDPASLTAAVTNAVHSVDPELAVANVRTLERHASAALASRRFALSLFESFAVLALVLAAAGIYGLLAYIVQQRRKEFGIRAALGAGRASIRRVVLLDGLRMASGGALLCLLLIPIAARSLQAFLFNVGTYDLFTMTATPAALLVVSIWPASVRHGRQPETTRQLPFGKTQVGWFRFPEMVLSDVDIKR